MKRIFISSVQKEFSEERRALRNFIQGEALLRRYFSVFLFEDLPATDRRADQVYLNEVDRCDIFVGLFGTGYGSENAEGYSPTEREFDRATAGHKTRFIFIKNAVDSERHLKMRALITKAEGQVVWRRFSETPELFSDIYAALVQYLEDAALIRVVPFDAAPCLKARLADLDKGRISDFIRRARRERGFPLSEKATTKEFLTHLNLLDAGRPTNAAILLFGRQPQKFLISSEVKCAHFHGTEATKPIPSYHVYKGDVFELVDQAVDFVMSKINLAVGTRARSNQVPVAYEIPLEVVREAIVNAVAHRDYTSNGSVQVMLFSNRLEIWNPGGLPPSLTLKMLRKPHGSIPWNPLLAEPLYLAKYIERMGTGTGDMIRRCREAGLPEPRFALTDGFVATLPRRPQKAMETVTAQSGGKISPQAPRKYPASTPQVVALLKAVKDKPRSRAYLQRVAGIRDREHFRREYLKKLLTARLFEPTIPGKPTSSRQKYRITSSGRNYLANEKKPTLG